MQRALIVSLGLLFILVCVGCHQAAVPAQHTLRVEYPSDLSISLHYKPAYIALYDKAKDMIDGKFVDEAAYVEFLVEPETYYVGSSYVTTTEGYGGEYFYCWVDVMVTVEGDTTLELNQDNAFAWHEPF